MKRTPVNFPRMKVRGHRNREKTARRIRTVRECPVRIGGRGEGAAVTFEVVHPIFATHYMRMETVTDGWGRVIG